MRSKESPTFESIRAKSERVNDDYGKVQGIDNVPGYTIDQINSFSLEIRCCYYLTPFNTRFMPRTIEEWAANVGYLKHEVDGTTGANAIREAINEAKTLSIFIALNGRFNNILLKRLSK